MPPQRSSMPRRPHCSIQSSPTRSHYSFFLMSKADAYEHVGPPRLCSATLRLCFIFSGFNRNVQPFGRTERMVRVDGRMGGAKYRTILDSAKDLRPRRRDNHPKRAARATMDGFQQNISMLEQPSLTPDLNLGKDQ